jgi:CRISPR-associated endonuclease/helicase Cas3
MTFEKFFCSATGGQFPYPYQACLADGDWPETRVIPTGFGKTAAVLGAWLWKVSKNDPSTPRRLVYCLPMRTLVEQTEKVARAWIETACRELELDVHLYVLMGGRSEDRRRIPEWIMRPERPTILVGTQDILVSAALMRGYGVSRYRWPVDFALLHNDALWIFDEVQLTGAALATSAQMESFRRTFGTAKSSRTLWMSATLNPDWLKTVDFTPADRVRNHDLSDGDLARADHLWNAQKKLARFDFSAYDLDKKEGSKTYAAAVARVVREHAKPGTNTIVFLNTVARTQAVFNALQERRGAAELLLIHSRFRARERAALARRIGEKPSSEGQIIVATQALEAGVDVTSAVMITEIAPWSSLVQRFGRCNRYGECAENKANVFWIDLSENAAAPYLSEEFDDARVKLNGLVACGPADLVAIPPSAPSRGQVIRRRDFVGLFDTDPDLSGFDVDVSPYVRDANDTDVRIFWRSVEGNAPSADSDEPERDELCPAPIGGAKELVKRVQPRAWHWNALGKEWCSVKESDIFPGLTIWIDSDVGGYLADLGFDPTNKRPVEPIAEFENIDSPEGDDDDSGSYGGNVLVSLTKHTEHVHHTVTALASALGVDAEHQALLSKAALWHDVGKAHPVFVAMTEPALTEGVVPPLAKWPGVRKGHQRPQAARKYFRHELASALAFLAFLDWSEEASLPAYLIAAHHGRVRMRLRSLPKEVPPENGRLFARGVWDGDIVPTTNLGSLQIPEIKLDLDIMQLGEGRCGPSWTERAQKLLKNVGPFRLAWIEAILRIADWQASAAEDKAGHDDL